MSSGTDYTLEDSVYLLFTTRAFATGIPGTLSASTVAVYEDVTATPILTSVAVTEDLNSIVGLNAVTIAATSGNGFNVGGAYHVVIEVGTVDSVSVVGEVIGNFTVGHSAAAVDLANGTDGLGAIKAETALIVGDTAGIAGAAMRGTDSAALATALTTAQNDLDILTGSDGVNLLSATQTSVDAIETDTNSLNDGAISELAQGVPSATPTLQNATMLLYMLVRNRFRTQTSGTDAIEAYNNAGTLIWRKLITDDGSDYNEAKAVTGA